MSRSSGLAKRASATVVESPAASSSSAAARQSCSRVPKESSATLVPSLTMRPLPMVEQGAALRHVDAGAVAARIAEGDRPLVIGGRGAHHVAKLGLVGGRHHHEAGQRRQEAGVEGAAMGRPVGADEAGAVDGKAHRQLLDRHVVHDLVVGALQEGRIDGGERPEAFGGQPRREGHRMLLGDADVEGAPRESLAEQIEAGARRHRRGDGDDAVVLLGLADEALGERPGVARRVGRCLCLRAGDESNLLTP